MVERQDDTGNFARTDFAPVAEIESFIDHASMMEFSAEAFAWFDNETGDLLLVEALPGGQLARVHQRRISSMIS